MADDRGLVTEVDDLDLVRSARVAGVPMVASMNSSERVTCNRDRYRDDRFVVMAS